MTDNELVVRRATVAFSSGARNRVVSACFVLRVLSSQAHTRGRGKGGGIEREIKTSASEREDTLMIAKRGKGTRIASISAQFFSGAHSQTPGN